MTPEQFQEYYAPMEAAIDNLEKAFEALPEAKVKFEVRHVENQVGLLLYHETGHGRLYLRYYTFEVPLFKFSLNTPQQ